MASSIRLLGSPALKEIRIHLCQTSSSSAGVRKFINENYVPLKKANLGFPILVRECSGIQPRIWFRYDHGKEANVDLTDINSSQVLATVKDYSSRTLS